MAKPATKKQPNVPWIAPTPALHITMALKAMAAGTATEEQQRAGMRWVIDQLCATYDLSYRPNSDRDSAFAEGKRFVGLQLVTEINFPIEILKRRNNAAP